MVKARKAMKPIPIAAAKRIAVDYGYDQVIILGRRCDGSVPPLGEHMTTYGINKQHCSIAGRVGSFLRRKVLKWYEDEDNV